jgi:hypothetical protein
LTELLPLLKPLKGNFGGIKSLEDVTICRNDKGRLVIRFSISIANLGNGDLHVVLGEPETIDGKTRSPAKQIICQEDGSKSEITVGYFDRHIEEEGGHTHTHWHYPNLASLDLINKDGIKVAESDKEGYCVIDSFRYPNFSINRPQQFFHEGCEQINKVGLGITVGWCDYYKYDTDLQYIDIEDLPAGNYTIKFTINQTKMRYNIGDQETFPITITEEDKKIQTNCNDLI